MPSKTSVPKRGLVDVAVGLADVVRGEQLADERDQARGVERLLQVVGGAELERLDRGVDGAAAGDDDHRGRRLLGLRRRPAASDGARRRIEIDARHPGQVEIGDEDVGGRALVDVERLLAARRDDDVEPLVPQHGLEDGGLVRLVLDQDTRP